MPYSLYDPTIEVVKPKFWIARPNKQIITRVKELDELASLRVDLGGINEISGEIPYSLNRNGKTIKNPHIKYIKNKYLIKMEFMNKIEWFVIENVSKNGNEENDTISFSAYNLAYNLRGKKLYNDKFEGKTPKEVMDELLSGTSWATGKVSSIISSKIRSFDEFSPNTNIIEAINTISESYGGIPSYDSEDKLINILHKDDYSIVSNLMLNDKNYIQSYQKESDTNEIITRLYASGEDGLSIAGISPTGKMYIDKFDYFMYPFKRDENKNVLSHSDFMSDELCHAILDQQEAIKEIEPLVKEKQEEINELTDSLTSLEDTEDEMRLKYETVEGILDFMRANEEYYYSEFLASGKSYQFTFRQGYFIGQARAKNGSTSAQLSFGGTVRNLTSDWTTFKYDKSSLNPLSDGESMTVTSLTSDNCEFYIVRVPKEEYDSYTDTQVKEKYNGLYWKDEYDSSKNSYETKQNEIDTLQSELEDLYKSVGDDEFYTIDLLREKDEFIHENHWEEPTHTDAQELYDDAVEKLKELHKPKLSIETDIFNFLASLDDKRNWKKLILGSRVRVKHSRLDEYNEVILTGIEYDFANDNIKLTLEDIKDLNGDEYAQMIMQGANASSTLNLNKKLWDDNVEKSKTFDEILKGEWDATKRRILAGIRESITIDNRGLRAISPDYTNNMLILNSGVLAISNDGGQTFKNALTTDGLIAERVIGRLFIGEKLIIRDDDGTMILNGSLQTIKDRSNNVKVKLGEYEKDKFGLQVLDGAVDIRTTSEANKGININSDGIYGYNGNSTPNFSLNNSGVLKAKNVNIEGTIYATDGTFTGELIGASGTFSGTVSASAITGSTFTTNGSSGGYNITTKIDSSGYEYIHSSYGGIKLQYGVLNNSNSAFLVVPTQSSSKGAFVLRGVQLQIESSNRSVAMFVDDSMVAISPNLYVTGDIYQRNQPIATQQWVSGSYSPIGHSHSSIATGYLTLSGGTLQAPSGSLWIGQNTVQANTVQANTVQANTITELSNEDYKKHITDWEYDALEMINSTPIRQFQYKTELDEEFPHVGVIVQEAPVWIVDITGEGVEPNKIAVLGWKAIQELDSKINALISRIEVLESK